MQDRKRRRRSRQKQGGNRSQIGILVGCLALLGLFLYLLLVYLSASRGGESSLWQGALALFAMLLSLICLLIGMREFRIKSYSRPSRIFGLMIPLIASLLWLGTYVVGILT